MKYSMVGWVSFDPGHEIWMQGHVSWLHIFSTLPLSFQDVSSLPTSFSHTLHVISTSPPVLPGYPLLSQ